MKRLAVAGERGGAWDLGKASFYMVTMSVYRYEEKRKIAAIHERDVNDNEGCRQFRGVCC